MKEKYVSNVIFSGIWNTIKGQKSLDIIHPNICRVYHEIYFGIESFIKENKWGRGGSTVYDPNPNKGAKLWPQDPSIINPLIGHPFLSERS